MNVDAEFVRTVCAAGGFIIVVGKVVANGFKGVESKIDAVNKSIQALQLDAKDKVPYTTCAETRKNCPCVKACEDLLGRVHELETR